MASSDGPDGGPPAPPHDQRAERRRGQLRDALREAVRGDVWFDRPTRAIYATDASNYRQLPLGVVCPLDADDAAAALRVCAAFDVPVTPRGAGTSLAGQAVNVGVIIDTGRHLTQILEIDPERKVARVQPGVVLDDLRRAAEAFGLTFGPDPATHAWCTIGGMLGNNACGTHALVAGKTSDNVERLSVLTYDGRSLVVGAGDDDTAVTGTGANDVARALRSLAGRRADAIRTGYPGLPRRVSGYNLDELLPERGFHIARALVGTEGTCVVVTEATLRLVHIPAHRRLVVLPFPDVLAAADAVPGLLREGLVGLEGFDATLVDSMRARSLNVEHLELLPPGGAWLYAEVGGDTPAEADAAAEAFVAGLAAGQVSTRVDRAEDQARLWAIRESGLGATAIRPDGSHNLEGWEDAAVPPERLGAYIREITALWAEFGYSGAWYGHFGQGCVHTRNNFDLRSAEGVATYRRYVERAAAIVVSLEGSFSGEHGDGQSRGELLGLMFSQDLITAFHEFKEIWDPRARMNPGKVIDARPLDADLRFGPGYHASPLSLARGSETGFAFRRDHGSFQAATERCVGVGRCRRTDAGVMCPSFRATGLEEQSTRGRAKLLAELFQGDATPETWRNDDVRDALDLCLSCKGCAVDCPTGVDVATYKAEFLSHYYRGRLRPRSAYVLGLLPAASRLATRVPRLSNGVLQGRITGAVLRRLGGITAARPMPRFASPSWRRSSVALDHAEAPEPTAVVWPDTFTDAFDPAAGDAVVALLEAAGDRIVVPRGWACCGRPLFDSGMLDVARAWMSRLLDTLAPWTSLGIPVVVPEPSCLAAMRDELPELLADDPRAAVLATLARSPAEHLLLDGRPDRLRERLAPPDARLVVHPHCHARAVRSSGADAALARALGFEVAVVDGGCCGLAGSFGYRAEHEPVSRTIGEDHWLPAVRRALDRDNDRLVIDGFSCVSQLRQLSQLDAASLCVTLARELLPAPEAGELTESGRPARPA